MAKLERMKKRFLHATIVLIFLLLLVCLFWDAGWDKVVIIVGLFIVWVLNGVHLARKVWDINVSISAKPIKSSGFVTRYLDGLHGIEIGASTQNSYHLSGSINVDFADDPPGNWQEDRYKRATVHLVSNGDDLPFKDNTLEYVLSSHNIEHYFDTIKALKEWWRVIKPGGYIVIIVPHKMRTYDIDRDETTIDEVESRHKGEIVIQDYVHKIDDNNWHEFLSSGEPVPDGWVRYNEDDHHHWTVWKTDGFLELCRHLDLPVVECLDPDDKVGNGFIIVIQKPV